jgi:hypothetical protein
MHFAIGNSLSKLHIWAHFDSWMYISVSVEMTVQRKTWYIKNNSIIL